MLFAVFFLSANASGECPPATLLSLLSRLTPPGATAPPSGAAGAGKRGVAGRWVPSPILFLSHFELRVLSSRWCLSACSSTLRQRCGRGLRCLPSRLPPKRPTSPTPEPGTECVRCGGHAAAAFVTQPLPCHCLFMFCSQQSGRFDGTKAAAAAHDRQRCRHGPIARFLFPFMCIGRQAPPPVAAVRLRCCR